MERKKVLIVDDEQSVCRSLELLLSDDFEVVTETNPKSALDNVASVSPDIILLDVMMPELDGIQFLKAMRERGETVPVIMLTAANTVKTAVEAMKLGALDYLNKPFETEELVSLLKNSLSVSREKERVSALVPTPEMLEADFGPLVGKSEIMQALYEKMKTIAASDTTVLITGESGTGKELVARQLHALSKRSKGPFIAINCGAIPETLIESELFGHEKGAFTSAIEQRVGYFELAHNGTLFLDEIGELSLNVQVKILRFLQEREFFRVGSSQPRRVNVRVLTATNKELEDLVTQKKFREDLYYRINVIQLNVPPLRDRFEDIPDLINHFIKKYSPVYGERTLSFTEEAVEALIQYSWPGNVREMENLIESLLALANKEEITVEDLPPKIRERKPITVLKEQVWHKPLSLTEVEQQIEKEAIVNALKKTNYVQTKAAELLGISRRILKYKMDKLGITGELKAKEK
ncbi:MAG: sigma-54-dependent Fis family transcriptional regulator [Candidatus Dadabacteria bacterium]|nr:MAG: sigma-54-dependent Fis family transcriptional regulator [Candidatus Dadabacteria bacterium]